MKQQIEPVVTYLEQRLAKTIIVDTDLLLVGLFHRHGRVDLGFSLDSLHYCDYYLLRYAGLMVASAQSDLFELSFGIFPKLKGGDEKPVSQPRRQLLHLINDCAAAHPREPREPSVDQGFVRGLSTTVVSRRHLHMDVVVDLVRRRALA